MTTKPPRPSSRLPLVHGSALVHALETQPWLRRAAEAVRSVAEEAPHVEPLKGSLTRALPALQGTADPGALLRHWQSRTPGTVRSDARYRWELSHRIGAPVPSYAGAPASWRAWHAGDQARLEREPFDFEIALLLPIVLAENAELLLELSQGGADAGLARDQLREAAPILRRDFARYVQMVDPWDDTFALWCLTRQPRALSFLHPLAETSG